MLADMKGCESRTIGGVQVDVFRAGAGRVKRAIYQPGFRWSTHLKPIVGTEWCQHAHVGFIARGQINVGFSDGHVEEFIAPQAYTVGPGHDGWVVGSEPAVVIEFDFEGQTAEKFGLPGQRSTPPENPGFR
jgi:prepilin-type processing-associated H-X9-DG protein